MSLFLNQTDRYAVALKTFDPLGSEPFFKLLDPLPPQGERTSANCQIRYGRICFIFLLLVGPQAICSLIKNPTAGGHFGGVGGFSRDLGQVGQGSFILLAMILLALGRRILGDLINELVECKVTRASVFDDFSPERPGAGRVLSALEWVTRPDWKRALIWSLLVVGLNLNAYHGFIGEQRDNWVTSAAQPGTLFYWLHQGVRQPNMAGLWIFSGWSACAAWMVVLSVRMIVSFAFLCSRLAGEDDLQIVPSNPDGAGGLMYVGQVSLFLSLFTVIIGVDMMFMSLNELIFFQTSRPNADSNLTIIAVFWVIYLAIGAMLFFLPVLPLRKRMATAKRAYLHEARATYAVVNRRHAENFRENKLGPDSLQEQTALGQLISTADSMAIWPFDRETFMRFAGVLLGPIAPLLLDRVPVVLDWIKVYLLGSKL